MKGNDKESDRARERLHDGFQDRVLLIDKPAGITSFRAIEEVGRILGVRKIGHAGTLDRFASGLLVVCTGFMTRLTRYFMESDKRYVGEMRLGIVTDTGDGEGAVIRRCEPITVGPERAAEVESRFTGEMMQRPPDYSALKINGRRASDLVREGRTVDLKERKVFIKLLKVREFNPGQASLVIEVLCTKGTYIRSLARDIGEFLGTGAYLKELRRVASGRFTVEQAVTPGDLRDYIEGKGIPGPFCLSPAKALADFGLIRIREEALGKVQNGAGFGREDILELEQKEGTPFRILDGEENLVAIADVDMKDWTVRYRNVFNG